MIVFMQPFNVRGLPVRYLTKCFPGYSCLILLLHLMPSCFIPMKFAEANKTEEYCRICSMHTMCRFPQGFKCYGYVSSGLTDVHIREIMYLHNFFRNYVALGKEKRGSPGPQPPASNMRKLYWDKELALIAETWLRRCIFGNDGCRDTKDHYVGQNILDDKASFPFVFNVSLINNWYQEVQHFNSQTIGSHKYSLAMNYAQMVWAETELIGCAQLTHLDYRTYHNLFACNYGPGLFSNKEVYKIGKPQTACPNGTVKSKTFKALCKLGKEKREKDVTPVWLFPSSQGCPTRHSAQSWRFLLYATLGLLRIPVSVL